MATASSSTASRPVAGQALQDAVDRFRNVLDEKQRCELDGVGPIPDANSILVFTARLDRIDPNRRGRSFSSRLHTILLAVRNFCSVADTFVSSHPEIAALVWGSVKLTMLVISNYTSHYEAASDLFMRVGRLCPLFNEYLILYQSSTRLRQSLLDFHTSIVYFCKHVVEAVQRPWREQLWQAFRSSFEQEFKPDIDNIQQHSTQVKEEIALAQAQADSREQQLQALERENSSVNRLTAHKFFLHADDRLDQIREWQMQSNERKTQKRIQQLLDALSTYNYLRLLKQSRLKRYRNTSNWIFQTPEFHRWVDGAVPLLCCFGKIGSGKTIATASVIDHILSEQGSDSAVSFFFVDSGNQESLSPETIIRSILRQRLDSIQIPQKVLSGLEQLDLSSGLDELVKLLRMVMLPPRVSYVIIDGLDECEKPDRDRLLPVLSSLAVLGGDIRLFLSSRDGLRREIEGQFPTLNSLSMDCSLAHNDISVFIQDTVEEKIHNNKLIIRDPSLEHDIISALSHGAQGMFLWVTFQIYEICAQHCDEDIRNILKDLPKSLTEIYCRVLRRIKSRGHQKEAQRIFPWIAASKQLLSLSQLREAIAIEIGQQYSKPERLYNDMKNIALWCENLVQVDEEYELVQFAHSTISKFLTEEPLGSTLVEFCINLEDADHDVGEKCVTYLNFNNFKTTVARRPKPILLHDPARIAQSALGYQSRSASMLAKLRPKLASKPVDLSSLQGLKGEDSSTTYENLILGYPFLDYALHNWVLHTKKFRPETSTTWGLWENMVIHGHDLAEQLRGHNTFKVDDSSLVWAYYAHHYALIRVLTSSTKLSEAEKNKILLLSVEDNNVDALDILLERGDLGGINTTLLLEAAGRGHLRVVERLLSAGANINSARRGGTALKTATANGHIGTVKKFLVVEAGMDNPTIWDNGRTALQVAAEGGYLEVVKILLAAKADVNVPAAGDSGRTALQAAAEGGYLGVVETLLAAKADINAPAAWENGRTALQAAAGAGYLEIVKTLLAAKANVNTPAALYNGRTALQAAAEGGHFEVVKALLTAKADVNAPAAGDSGRTALQAAAGAGYLEVVKALLVAKADVNAVPARRFGRTALQAAAERGHLEVVERLLIAKANVNADPSNRGNLSALYATVEGDHLDVVERLLTEKGDIIATIYNHSDRTALYTAAGKGHLEVFKSLLLAQEDITTVIHGRTVLQAAKDSHHWEVVAFLE